MYFKIQSSVQFGEYLILLIARRNNVFFKVKYLYGSSSSLRTHYMSLSLENERSERSLPNRNWIFGEKNYLKFSTMKISCRQLMN